MMKLENFLGKMNPVVFPRAGCLLACALASAAQADIGPALSGITARANDASSVFSSPAGRVKGDFDFYHALVLDVQLIKRF